MSEAYDGAAPAAAEDTTAAPAADETSNFITHAEPPASETGGDTGDDAAAAAAEGEGDPPKPRKTAQERIDELTRKSRDAEREAAYWRGKAEGSTPREERQPARQEEDAEPDPADFTYGETDPNYIKALTAHTVRQEHARISHESRRRDAVQTVETTWSERQQAFAKDKPDYFERTNAEDLPVSPVMAAAIKTSEDGPAVAYHLATHPDEARRIAGLPQIAQVREIGKLEARLAKPASTLPKTVSDAPAPAPQVRGANGRFGPGADTTDFAAFEKMAGGG